MNKTGFTLIELILTLLIFGILITIAFPSYQAFICKTRRTDGQTALLNLAIQMENWYAQNQTYSFTNPVSKKIHPPRTQSKWYHIEIIEQNQKSFTLHAVPILAQVKDKQCQTLTLNSTNRKGIAPGPGGVPLGQSTDCW